MVYGLHAPVGETINTRCTTKSTVTSRWSKSFGIRATPNPIKHWRKQLFPRQGTTASKARATISQLMDRPGGTLNITDVSFKYI